MQTRITLLLAASALLAASTSSAQPFLHVGAGGETESTVSYWVAGAGFDARLPFAPVSAGILAQTTIGSQKGNDVWPTRALGVIRAEFLPSPLVRAYAGGGGGFSFLAGGEGVVDIAATGVLLGGIGVGRLHFEFQLQRDWVEKPINRWNTVVGVTF